MRDLTLSVDSEFTRQTCKVGNGCHHTPPNPPPLKKRFSRRFFYLHLPFTVAVRIHPFEKMLPGEKYKRWAMRGSGKFVTGFRFFILKIIQWIIQRVNQRMLCYYNVHVSKNRARFNFQASQSTIGSHRQ